MKNLLSYFLILFVVGITATSCLNNDDDAEYTTYGFLPATQVEYSQDSIQGVNKPTNIHVTFNLNGSCQEFVEFRVIPSFEDAISNYGIFGSQTNNTACTDEIRVKTKTFKFIPRVSGENIIKLWAGKDANGQDIYISKTINIPAE